MKFHHIGIAVKNIEKELENYKSILDIEITEEIIFDSNQSARLCMLTLKDGTKFELVEGIPVKEYLKKGVQMYHVCYEVLDIDEEIMRLEQKHSIVVSGPSPAVLFKGKKVAFLYTAIGLIELVEE